MAAGFAVGRFATPLAAAVVAFSMALPAASFEFLDGRVQIHGFAEMQVRAISSKYNEELDLTQWYNVLNVEAEFDILPDGWGPIDLLSAYARVEARYDCIWTQGCGMFNSVNTFGDGMQRLPTRLKNAEDEDYGGVIRASANVLRTASSQQPARIEGPRESEENTRASFVDPDLARAAGNDNAIRTNPNNINVIVERKGYPGFDALFKVSRNHDTTCLLRTVTLRNTL